MIAMSGSFDVRLDDGFVRAKYHLNRFYRRRRAGALGDAAGFSFYPGKNLGTLIHCRRGLCRTNRK